MIKQQYCNRNDLWTARSLLINNIRPNRQATATAVARGQLRRLLSNGEVRDLDVLIGNGPEFSQEIGEWDEWGFKELLRFVAFNPVIYNPTQQTQSNWDLPNGAVNDTQNLTYPGTWEEYPTLVIVGPLHLPIITNTTTGEVIALTYDIPAGRTVTITLTYGQKTVVDDLGVNLIGTVTTASDLATFHLAPDPEGALGVNAIQIEGHDSILATTDFTVKWYNRYIGI